MIPKCPACECPHPSAVCRRCGKVQAVLPMRVEVVQPRTEVLTLQQLEKRAIKEAVDLFGPKEAARRLGIQRKSLWLKRKAYGLMPAKNA